MKLSFFSSHPKMSFPYRIIIISIFATTCLLVLNVFLRNDVIEYTCKQTLDISTQWIFGISILILIFLLLLGIKLINSDFKIHKYFLLINFIVLAFQFIYAYNMYFFTGWDVNGLLNTVHYILNKSSFVRINAMYTFSIYPNNLGMLFVLLPIEWVSRVINVDGYLVSMFISVISVNLAGLFMYYVVERMTQKSIIALSTWIIYCFLMGFSPWITIPYTDTYTILFPISAIYIITTNDTSMKSVSRLLLLGFILFLGIYIKPTVAIMLVAIILSDILSWKHKSVKKSFEKTLISIGLIILGGLPVILGYGYIHKTLSKYFNTEARFTALHYLNMGLNNQRDGVFAGDDVNYSKSFETVKERNEANIARIKERLADFGLAGYVEFLSRKALVNFADGSFGWGVEGNFFRIIPQRNHPINQLLNSYILREGDNYSKFITWSQFPWYLCLLILPFLSFTRGHADKQTILICISILGIMAFLMLFEARARYLINYIPVFLVGVGLGYYNLISLVGELFIKKKSVNC